MSVEIEGFEEMADELDRFGERLDSVGGETTVSFDDIFTADFMRTYTEYDSIGTFFAESPWSPKTEADFIHIPASELDEYVDAHTGFNSWEAMLSAAAREWLTRNLSN